MWLRQAAVNSVNVFGWNMLSADDFCDVHQRQQPVLLIILCMVMKSLLLLVEISRGVGTFWQW